MSCEKASKRLRCIIGKAKRLGLTELELADLPVSKRITSLRTTSSTSSFIFMIVCLIVGGCLALALVCSPCTDRRSVYHVHHNNP